ncbi:MAG: hypothetical protein ACW96U_00095 [Candidatus Heimdallarchaeaceae archaeon]|jgi:hypothetical protein
MALDVETSLKMVQDLWRQDSNSTVSVDTAKKYFSRAVYHVEYIDYSQSNIFTVSNDQVTFTSTPSDISYMLYVYKALEFIARAFLSDDINDSDLGVSWRSGMETISTATAGRIKQSLSKEFVEQYKNALSKAKLKSHSPERINIYGTFDLRDT